MRFDSETFHTADDGRPVTPRRNEDRGRTAVWQSRLVMLVMINLAQLWILSAAIEAALARHFGQLWPLIIASAVCWAIALTIFLWWKPAPKRSRPAGGTSRK
jgi:cytochrome bd-type quinol oxidase subunit 2